MLLRAWKVRSQARCPTWFHECSDCESATDVECDHQSDHQRKRRSENCQFYPASPPARPMKIRNSPSPRFPAISFDSQSDGQLHQREQNRLPDLHAGGQQDRDGDYHRYCQRQWDEQQHRHPHIHRDRCQHHWQNQQRSSFVQQTIDQLCGPGWSDQNPQRNSHRNRGFEIPMEIQ